MIRRSLALASIVVAALTVTACGGATTAQDTTATAAVPAGMTRAPLTIQAHGRARMISDAIAEVPLRPEQRTQIEQLARDSETRHQAGKVAHTQLLEALATQVEAGKIDRAALQPKIDAVVDFAAKSHPADQAAFEQLHAILDATQRAQLVDAVEAHVHSKLHGDHAEQGAPADHEKAHHEHFAKIADDLKLTDDQKDKIKDIFKEQMMAHHGDFKAMHAKGKAMMDAFKNDRFVMSEVEPQVDVRAKATEMTTHVLDVAEKILPMLTPEQRTLAAAKIREHEQSDAPLPIGE